MKTVHSKEYYINNWERFINDKNNKYYMNFEDELQDIMETFNNFPEDVYNKLTIVYAGVIIENAKKKLIEVANMISEIKQGKASLGYTTKSQEIHVMHDIVNTFEFNCVQLSVFSDKYKENTPG